MSQEEQILFKELYLKFRPGLISFSMGYVKNEPDAQEVVNDVFMAIWNKRNEFELDSKLKSYLFTAVKNRSLNVIRKQKQLAEIEIGDWDFPTTLPDITEKLEAKNLQQKIDTLIDSLPPKCKQVFLLSRMEELSYKQIAEIMDTSPKTVENQIGHALKYLRSYLQVSNTN